MLTSTVVHGGEISNDVAMAPLNNVKTMEIWGPELSDEAPYSKVKVITTNGKCYNYLMEGGQFIKYKKCADYEWKIINHNFIIKKQ